MSPPQASASPLRRLVRDARGHRQHTVAATVLSIFDRVFGLALFEGRSTADLGYVFAGSHRSGFGGHDPLVASGGIHGSQWSVPTGEAVRR